MSIQKNTKDKNTTFLNTAYLFSTKIYSWYKLKIIQFYNTDYSVCGELPVENAWKEYLTLARLPSLCL